MTDYSEEQQNEVEALGSIYPDEFEFLEDSQKKFKITIKSEDYDEDGDEGAAVDLVVKYTPNYPDDVPLLDLIPLRYFEDEDLDDLKIELEEQCSENIGMVMIFILVSFTQEYINLKLEMDRKALEEEEALRKKAIEETERKKFEGTRVTVESFLKWKKDFDAERLAALGNKDRNDERNKKLSGRELFMTDITLNESDLSFLGAENDEVAVDESLFEDLDDLDLSDEDDPDYDPNDS